MLKEIPSIITEPVFKVETSAHHSTDTKLIAETEAGPVYRFPLKRSEQKLDVKTIAIPEFLLRNIASSKSRRNFVVTFHWNSSIGASELGRANSAFLFNDRGNFYIDHLLEYRDHKRQETSNLHTFMREVIDYTQAEPILGRMTALSGHITPLNISESSATYILLLDALQGRDIYSCLPNETASVIDLLYQNRIIPVTTDGHIIK